MNDFKRETFSHRLKALREEKGMDQAALAEASGVSANAIARYETGRNIPGIDKAVLLAKALGCSTDVLIGCVPLSGVA